MLAITHVFAEPLPVVESCLREFRNHYRDTQLVVIGDGVAGEYQHIAEQVGAEWISGQMLKRVYDRPLWTDRLMQVAAERTADRTILFDPDTRFWRNLKRFPDAGLCGQILDSLEGTIPTVNGCCCVLRDDLVRGYLSLDRARLWPQLPDAYRRYMRIFQQYKHDQWMPTIVRALGAKIAETYEVGAMLGGQLAPNNTHNQFAVTHPHKTIESWS